MGADGINVEVDATALTAEQRTAVDVLTKKIEANINEASNQPPIDLRDMPDTRLRIAKIIDETIGSFDDHVTIHMRKAPGNRLVVDFEPKDAIGEAFLRRAGIIQTLNDSIDCITFNINVEK